MERVQPPRRLRGAGKVQEGGGVAPILREPFALAAQEFLTGKSSHEARREARRGGMR
jgi:hypothetical protein